MTIYIFIYNFNILYRGKLFVDIEEKQIYKLVLNFIPHAYTIPCYMSLVIF